MPTRSGRSVRPNPPYWPKRQNEVVTCTWFRIRYAPAAAMISPRKNDPVPPGVPPAPRGVGAVVSAMRESIPDERVEAYPRTISVLLEPRARSWKLAAGSHPQHPHQTV